MRSIRVQSTRQERNRRAVEKKLVELDRQVEAMHERTAKLTPEELRKRAALDIADIWGA